MQTHETVSSFRKIVLGSNRKFGLTFGAVFLFLGVSPLLRAGSPRWALIAIAIGFFIAAICRPDWLMPLNSAWFKFGLVLNKIISPIIMGLLFFGVVAPFGWLLRRQGRDLLDLALKPEAETYWIQRDPPGPAQGTLSKQF